MRRSDLEINELLSTDYAEDVSLTSLALVFFVGASSERNTGVDHVSAHRTKVNWHIAALVVEIGAWLGLVTHTNIDLIQIDLPLPCS
jgi:hypothetical protein